MSCLAAFNMLLYGYTGQEDLCVATLLANRTQPQTEALIGLLVNTVILRTDLGGDPTCREVLRRVRATTLAAHAHQDFPFEELMRILERQRQLQRTALGQVMMIWQNFLAQPFPDSAQTVRFEVMTPSVVPPYLALTTFDLVLILREGPEDVTGTCLYKTDLFDASTISRLVDDLQSVLTGLADRPNQALATFRGIHERHT
jgi:non-ribosomal peptide synthetase component F